MSLFCFLYVSLYFLIPSFQNRNDGSSASYHSHTLLWFQFPFALSGKNDLSHVSFSCGMKYFSNFGKTLSQSPVPELTENP